MYETSHQSRASQNLLRDISDWRLQESGHGFNTCRCQQSSNCVLISRPCEKIALGSITSYFVE